MQNQKSDPSRILIFRPRKNRMKRKGLPIVLSIFLLLLAACQKEDQAGFTSHRASKTGIDFVNQLTPRPELNILNYLYYYNGSGVAAGDFNQDGFIDLFFGGNQVADELYLNQGDWKFKKVTVAAGLNQQEGWTTGVNQVDINGDGLLDIYICRVAGYEKLKGNNLLYINQGNDADGIPQFKEEGAKYGLNFSGYATHSAFFDMDGDGDLDAFLLNHSVHPNRTYGRGDQRMGFDPRSGDRLYENKDGRFVDVSTRSGIYQGKTGYGLGLSVGYLTDDGLPDLYVGNDFFENDYFYKNAGEGRFEELLAQNDDVLGHTTHFSMGNTIFDLNRDGLFDLFSLDMLPEDLLTYKTSGLEYPFPIYQQYLKRGYHPQFMQNTLHLNLGEEKFSEIAFLSGVAATEWSWGAVAGDFDQDGWEDLFISNGIQGATNNMDFINFIANDQIQKRLDAGMQEKDLPLIEEIPAKATPNYVFRNKGDLSFSNETSNWLSGQNSMSQGAIQVDLDNDGDLDLVVSNTNSPVELLENTISQGNWLQLAFEGPESNTQGVGVRAQLFTNGEVQNRALFPGNSYLSSNSNRLHFGLGQEEQIDSLRIHWPDGRVQNWTPSGINQLEKVSYQSNSPLANQASSNPTGLQLLDSVIGFNHRDNATLDFDRSPLIPFASSNQGPCIAVADVNQDGLEDVFIGGAKAQASELYFQTENGFEKQNMPVFEEKALNEDTAALFFDANGDGWLDLVVGSAGNEFQKGSALEPRIYLNQNGQLTEAVGYLPKISLQSSSIESIDFDQDGKADLFLTGHAFGGAFGKAQRHYLLRNTGEGFEDVSERWSPQLMQTGILTDQAWVDWDKNGTPDLLVVGHWSSPQLYLNNGSQLVYSTPSEWAELKGLWNSIELQDLDGDGTPEVLLGNWGLNSKWQANADQPLRLYRSDFDKNGSVEPLITYYLQGTETPFSSKDDLVKQMPFLNKKFLSYEDFASASMEELFGKEALAQAEVLQVNELRSGTLRKKGESGWNFEAWPQLAQSSPVFDIYSEATNGELAIYLVGNLHQISTQLGRLDAQHGLILRLNNQTNSWVVDKTPWTSGAARQIARLNSNKDTYYLVGINNGPLQVFRNSTGE